MKAESLNSGFLFALEKMRATRPSLVHEISDILNMDANSVYRRLRGAVKFSIDEMGGIARHYHLSLDNLLSEYPEGNYQAWKMDLLQVTGKNGLDPDAIERNLPLIHVLPNLECTELGGALGSLTRQFYMHHKHLWRFMHFKWGRYYSNSNIYNCFDTVQISPKLSDLFDAYMAKWKGIKYAFFIWDSLIIQKLVNDIRYYKSMSLLTEENVLLIKQDVVELLDNCERAAVEGKHRDIVGRFEIYISPINIDTSQVYLQYGEHWSYSIEVHGIRPIITSKPHVCKEFAQSINRLKNASILISKSAERERRRFFNQQYELLDSI